MLRLSRLLRAAPELPMVVGAGQIGCHFVKALGVEGCPKVKLLDAQPRLPKAAAAAAPPGCEVDYTWHKLGSDKTDHLVRALQGVDCVFSVLTSDVEKATREEHMRTNVDGIRELVAACQAAGVPRLVHVSSIAVTDHFRETVEGKEEDPLPPIEEYRSAYDLTKRLGEAVVLEGNGTNLATVSLRAGGIIASPWDYGFRRYWERPGNVVTVGGARPIDFMAAQDLSRAAILASERLDSPAVAGQAFFVSKGEAITSERIAEIIGEKLGWPVTKLPEVAVTCIGFGMRVSHTLKQALGQPVPGVAPHDFLALPRVQKTFDNSKAFHVLGFKSQLTVEDAVIQVVSDWEEYSRNNP